MAQTMYHTVKDQDANIKIANVSGTLTVDGASTLTGAVTAPAGVTGAITGNVTGDVTGDLTGNVDGEVRNARQTLTISGAITLNSGLVILDHISVIIAATLDAPAIGDELYIVDFAASGTPAHTVTTAAGVTFDGTNNTATLNAPDEALFIIALSATRWFIMVNVGSVALSSV